MSSSLYSTNKKILDSNLDLKNIKPYGDTMNDGKVQISFTLPVAADERGSAAAIMFAKQMGLIEPSVALCKSLDKSFSFYILYGSIANGIDYNAIKSSAIEIETMSMHDIEKYIEVNIKRDVIFVGASTGTDAHTVGIDAIFNMKGYAGHYGLERYKHVSAYNLGSQIPNEEFIAQAVSLNADALLISQTVTQKDVHIKNLTNLIELLEAENLRERFIVAVGGARITNELAKELGYDAGFGTGKYAEDIASFVVKEISKKMDNQI